MNANAADHEGLIEAIQDGNEVQWLAARDARIRADVAAEVLAPIEAVAHSAVKRSSARGPYIETVSVEELSAALSAANDNGATSPHETAPNAAQGNLASLAGTSATKEATWDEVGGSMWLDRHQWGVIIDGLVLQRAEALTRKAANEYSNSDERAEMCVDLIRRINAADSLALSAAKEATNDE